MSVIDIAIVPVARERRDEYIAFSKRMAEVYRDHGATRIVDYWQADGEADQQSFHGAEYEEGDLRGIASAVGASASEAVVVSITEWPSQQVRDRGTAAAAKDPRVLATLDEKPVFDGARLLGDSFTVALEVR